MNLTDITSNGIAFVAIAISLFTLWHSSIRKGKLEVACSRWAITPVDLRGSKEKTGVFILKISAINTGTQPIMLRDLLLQVRTHNNKVLNYIPSLLIDSEQLLEMVAKNHPDAFGDSQRGTVPLPVAVPAGSDYGFGHDIMFSPFRSEEVLLLPEDTPFELCLYALTSRDKQYQLVVKNTVSDTGAEDLVRYKLNVVPSNYFMAEREAFLERQSDE